VLDSLSIQHLQRIRTATTNRVGRKDIARWIEQNTFINGRPFSFKGHEYQERILQEDSVEIVVKKSAQTGISEMSMRLTAACMAVMPAPFAVGYTLPTATFASTYAASRFDPIVQTSPALKGMMSSSDLDNALTKTFGPGKAVYFKGAAVGNAAISTTLDFLINDEVSFSDQEILGDYHSRLLHSQYKWKLKLSTPTFMGDPIDNEFQNSRRHFNHVRCCHCYHSFIPDYFTHVVIPGYKGALEEITKDRLHKVRYAEAMVICPKCGREPDLSPAHRHWECENPSENHRAVGFQVSPFDAPTIVTPASLVIASTSYASLSKFKQFSLGQCAQDADAGLTEEDLENAGVQIAQSPFTQHFIGMDVGITNHIMVGGLDYEGRLGVVHMERVHLSKVRERLAALTAEYRATLHVVDMQPMVDLVMGLTEEYPNLYAGMFVTRQGLELFEVKVKEQDEDRAQLKVKQVNLNRNALLDKLLAEMRAGRIWIRKTDEWELVKAHLQDQKRATATLRDGEFKSIWQKSAKGNDHYTFSLLYLYVAAQMRGLASFNLPSVPGVMKFKLKTSV
jgi:hypothetical protein